MRSRSAARPLKKHRKCFTDLSKLLLDLTLSLSTTYLPASVKGFTSGLVLVDNAPGLFHRLNNGVNLVLNPHLLISYFVHPQLTLGLDQLCFEAVKDQNRDLVGAPHYLESELWTEPDHHLEVGFQFIQCFEYGFDVPTLTVTLRKVSGSGIALVCAVRGDRKGIGPIKTREGCGEGWF
ncbi:Putative prefoldin subunit 3 [Verticillium dahliae VDG1]|nr:Putative prefoldin subunit 3 [Verticillium dahliae VDG1]